MFKKKLRYTHAYFIYCSVTRNTNDLFQEALNDMNEELQENAKATELELREEVDMKNIKQMEVEYIAITIKCKYQNTLI